VLLIFSRNHLHHILANKFRIYINKKPLAHANQILIYKDEGNIYLRGTTLVQYTVTGVFFKSTNIL
jgi:hypothetical protein